MTAAGGQVDRVLLNANVITMSDEEPKAEALAVAGDRIVAIGPASDVRSLAGPGTVVEDLGGATLLPGLIDAHNHLLATGQILQQVQLYDCRSIDDILAKVKRAAERTPTGHWILGRGWDESLLAERRHPTRYEL